MKVIATLIVLIGFGLMILGALNYTFPEVHESWFKSVLILALYFIIIGWVGFLFGDKLVKLDRDSD
ncbi:MAG: hypothetical protein ACJAXM_000759 [Arenicella sp.]